MARNVDDADSDAVLLRTTADVVSHALTQMDCCAKIWLDYKADADAMRGIVERIVSHAREYGYIEKRGRV